MLISFFFGAIVGPRIDKPWGVLYGKSYHDPCAYGIQIGALRSVNSVQLLEHTAKLLPSAKVDPRQNFSGDRPDDVARIFAVCFPGLAHDKG